MKSPKYQIARRNPNVRTSRSGSLEDICGSAHGMEHRGVEPFIDLLPQTEDRHVDEVAAAIEAVAAYLRQNHGLRDDAPGVAHQELEDRELARSQLARTAAPLNGPRQPIEREIPD